VTYKSIDLADFEGQCIQMGKTGMSVFFEFQSCSLQKEKQLYHLSAPSGYIINLAYTVSKILRITILLLSGEAL